MPAPRVCVEVSDCAGCPMRSNDCCRATLGNDAVPADNTHPIWCPLLFDEVPVRLRRAS